MCLRVDPPSKRDWTTISGVLSARDEQDPLVRVCISYFGSVTHVHTLNSNIITIVNSKRVQAFTVRRDQRLGVYYTLQSMIRRE